MAQTGYSKVQIYSSSTATHTPSAGNLTNDTNGSELAINITDGKLFYKDNSGTVQVLATKGSGVVGGSNTQVQYNSSGTFAGSANLTFDGATLTSSGFSGPLNGSVGATTANTGAFTTLSASSTVSGTGFSTYLASPPAIGGTAAAAGSFTTLGASGAVTLSGGTANGVAYLNGSKVLTTGSALVFDGTNLGLGVTPSAWYSGWKAIDVGNGAIATAGTPDFRLYSNAYKNTSAVDTYKGTGQASYYIQNNGIHSWGIAPSGTAGNAITFTQAMTLDASSRLGLAGITSPSASIDVGSAVTSQQSLIVRNSANSYFLLTGIGSQSVGIAWNAANASLFVSKDSTTNRSINASGTVNVGGLDYAEYMIKSSDFTIAKGDVVGINANGKLTNVFADAVSFVVKSTNPSYVGGDVWGTPEALGLSKLKDDATDEEKATFNAALEAARQNVDRIAFSGQVPVNVTGATAGQYIVPIANQDGSIGGQAISESEMTLQQYMQSVGKVISVVGHVTTIIVKVA